MSMLEDKLVIFFAGSRLPRDFVVEHLARFLKEWLVSEEGEQYLKALGYERLRRGAGVVGPG